MKSRKLKAVLAAVSALAVLATAMTGFAATTTTYNTGSDKVNVTATLPATNGDEVTYLVTTGDGADKGVSGTNIVYIDQQKAENNEVKFEYKVDKKYITTLNTTVTTGSNGATVAAEQLTLNAVSATAKENYTVEYYQLVDSDYVAITAVGNAEADLYAKVVAADNYKVDKVYVNDVEEAGVTAEAFAITVDEIGKVTADVSVKEVTPVINGKVEDSKLAADGDYAGKYVNSAIIAYDGTTVTEVGVKYNDVKYPAILDDGTDDGYVVVQLITTEGIVFGDAYIE